MSVAWVGVGVAAAGAVSQANSASKASKAQGKAAEQAAELERETRDLTRADNAPFLERGNQAGNRLQYLMGLGGGSTGSSSSVSALPDRETLRSQLAGQYTRSNTNTAPPVPSSGWSPEMQGIMDGVGVEGNNGRFIGGPANTSSIDEAGLNAEIDRQMAAAEAQRAAQTQAAEAAAQSDPNYGSLMRKFTMADRDADPVYQSGLQFGLDQGTNAINNRASAGGAFLSGATLKALTRFGNDYGSTKAEGARNRFVNDQDNQYNRLAGIVGTGQTATNQVGQANNAYAARAGDYLTQGGNASAAGYMGQGNALANGLNTGFNMYQNNELMNKIRNPGGGWGSAGGWSGGGRVVPDYPGAEY